MADVDVIIRLPEEIRQALINNIQLSPDQQSICDSYMQHAIINGIPLPKGHGRLIDVDAIPEQIELKGFLSQDNAHLVTIYRVEEALNNAPTIVEADVESEE